MRTSSLSTYKDLVVWQKAHLLATKTIELIGTFPKTWVSEVLAKQLLSSATSISANIAEGFGRGRKAEYTQYLRIARGSATETDNWLSLMHDANLGDKEKLKVLINLCVEIIRMLTTMTKPPS